MTSAEHELSADESYARSTNYAQVPAQLANQNQWAVAAYVSDGPV